MPRLGRQRALDQRGDLRALPRGQHVAEAPGQRGADQRVGHPFGQRKGRAGAAIEQVRLDQPEHRGGNRCDQVAPHREAVRDGLRHHARGQQAQRARVCRQQSHREHAAQQGTGHTRVAPLQCLRQAAAQHHHDGQQDPVVVRAPGQRERDGIAAGHRQRGAQRMAQRRRIPVPQRQQWRQRPGRGAHEHLPVGAHHGQVGLGLAARQRHQAQHLVVDVTHAVGQAARQQGGRRARARVGRGGARGERQRRQARPAVRHRGGAPADQHRVGQRFDLARQFAQHLADFGQCRSVGRVRLQRIEVEFGGQQVVACFDHHHQHAGQLLAPRRARRLEHDVARGLQLVGQRGVLTHQLAQHGRGHLAPVARFVQRRELARLRAHQRRQRQQRVGDQQHAVARIEGEIRERRVDHVQAGAQAHVQRGDESLAQVGRRGRRHREDHRQHHRDRDRNAALAPGHREEGDESRRHQHQREAQRRRMQPLHRKEQGQPEQRRRQHLAQLAAARRRQVGRRGHDHTHGGGERRDVAQPQVHAANDQQQSERDRQAVGDIVVQGHPQCRLYAARRAVGRLHDHRSAGSTGAATLRRTRVRVRGALASGFGAAATASPARSAGASRPMVERA